MCAAQALIESGKLHLQTYQDCSNIGVPFLPGPRPPLPANSPPHPPSTPHTHPLLTTSVPSMLTPAMLESCLMLHTLFMSTLFPAALPLSSAAPCLPTATMQSTMQIGPDRETCQGHVLVSGSGNKTSVSHI
ncbi:hypothetical protein ACOMHN_023711 [Nucella lapillus]